MFFSIIVPVYNVESYLCECVDSILNQSFKDFELILVDDGSKDNSLRICDNYALQDERVKVMCKPNGGAADARNIGTNSSEGNYIVYIDSDDYICDIDFLYKLYERAKRSDSDIICYKFKKYYEDKKKFVDCNFSCPDIEQYHTLAEKISYMVKCNAFYCSPWSKAFKAKLMKDNHIQFEKGLIGEDQDWYYHLLLHSSTITFIDEVFIVYRQRSNSVTSSWKIKNLADCIYIVRKWYKTILDSNIKEDYKTALLNSLAKLYCNLLIAYSRFDNILKKNHYGDLKALESLFQYHNNPRVNTFNKVNKVLGFDGLMITLKIICKLK